MAGPRILSPAELAGAEDVPSVDVGPGARRAMAGMAPPGAGMTDPNAAVEMQVDPAMRHQAEIDREFAKWGVPEAQANIAPVSAPAPSGPPPPRQLSPQELAGALDEGPPEDKGGFDAFTRNAANGMWFGLGPTVQAAGTLAEEAIKRHVLPGGENRPKYSYDQLRKFYAGMLDASREQHPVASEAGNVTGGVVSTVLAPEVKVGGAAMRSGVNAGLQSAAQGAGEAISHGKPAGEVARAATVSGLTGAAIGAPLGAVTSRFVERAPTQADNWVLKDIIGAEKKGGSTPTTRKQLVSDKADVIDVVESNPQIKGAIQKAEGGDPEHINAAQEAVDMKTKQVFAPRKGMYDELDRVTAGKPTTAGELVDSVQARVDELGKKLGTKKERNALRGVMEDVKETLGGGRRTTVDPEAEIVPGYKAADAYRVKQAELAKATTPEAKKAAQADLDSLLSAHGQVASWDPKTPVKSIVLRDSVTRLQDDVANAMGSLNEKISEQRAREVLQPVRDVLDAHLEKAAATNPMLVDAIKEMDRQGSALLRIQKMLDERAMRGEQRDLTGKAAKFMKVAHGVSGTGAALALGHGDYKTAAALAAAAAAPIIKRGADKAMAALIKKAAQGPLTGAELATARAQGVPAEILARLQRGAGQYAARGTVEAVKNVAPRVIARQAGKAANSFVDDFLSDEAAP